MCGNGRRCFSRKDIPALVCATAKAVQIHAIPRQNAVLDIPDFISLAKSYGASGMRVQKKEDIKTALLEAKKNLKAPTVIEFMIQREENVLPIVPPGNALKDMMMGGEEAK